jgi:hypothetical protein
MNLLQNIILPLISITIGIIYSKWLYKRNEYGFFDKKDDLFSKVQTLKGWFASLVMIVVGLLFLTKGILIYL